MKYQLILFDSPVIVSDEILDIHKYPEIVVEVQKLNLQAIADYTQVQVDKQFVRRDFKEFNYLTVEPPMWAIALTYLLTALINIGISWWIINNEYE